MARTTSNVKHRATTAAYTGHCPECDEPLIVTESGYLTCFHGHMRLIRFRDIGRYPSRAERDRVAKAAAEWQERRDRLAGYPLCGVKVHIGRRMLWWVEGKDGLWSQVHSGDPPDAIKAILPRSTGRGKVVRLRPLSADEAARIITG